MTTTRRKPAYWALRDRLTPRARSAVRRALDPVLTGVGSVRGARTAAPWLGLTFDDGPDTRHTPAILDVLAAHDVKATFFMLVERAEALPELARRVVAEGHEVALHGLDHRRLTTLPPAAVNARMRDGRARLERLAGVPVRRFRPPFGAQSLRTYLAARRQGLEVVVWSAEAHDWEERTAAEVARLAAERATPGGVLLLHDGLAGDPREPATVPPSFDRSEAVEALLRDLGGQGWRLGTVGWLLDAAPAVRTAWFRP
jgi:peptidoglycan/xylan/chitin deacetylase (PgdA/CDA1 family)